MEVRGPRRPIRSGVGTSRYPREVWFPPVERKTKIIATLGPASASPYTIGEMVAQGLDVARLNFSHGTYENHALWAGWVRDAAQYYGRAVAVLQDVQGPRIRVGTFPRGSVDLEESHKVLLLDGDGMGDDGTIFVDHLAKADLGPGSQVLLSDGLISLEIVSGEPGRWVAEVHQAGVLSDRKGAAFPGVRLGLPAITDKDRGDLAFGREIGVDLVAASFVETAADIDAVREIVGDTPVIAKLERASAYANLAEIAIAADGVMVARGDLGVELGLAPMPRAQKRIIAATNAVGSVSITATEMLESMTLAPRPTRAEVTDVANAVFDGTDAVMLSAETAVGRFPVKSVETMATICLEAEVGLAIGRNAETMQRDSTFPLAIASALADSAESLGLDTVVAFTESGSTARLVSKQRPRARIVAFTPNEKTYRRMSVMWGVSPMRFPRLDSTDEMIFEAERILLDQGVVVPGEQVAMAAGIPPNQRSSTNLLKLHVVGDGVEGAPED